MLKSIFVQLWNRKRSNLWLFFELLIVFCLVWYMVDYLFVINYNRSIVNHRDTAHTWQINLTEYPPDNPAYSEEENVPEVREANYNRILQAIRNYPGVEALAISFNGSFPGSGGYSGSNFINPADTSLNIGGQMYYLDPREDFFRVFRYTTGEGRTPVSVSDFDWANPQGVVVGQSVARILFPGESPLGKEIAPYYVSDHRYIIIGVVDDIKRFDYLRPQHAFYFSQRWDANKIAKAELSVRVNSSLSDKQFKEKFMKEMTGELQKGNFYLKAVTAYKAIEAETDTRFGVTKDIRVRSYLMTFFLLNILLCVIGTFWYRINIRKEEIGLRKALGSTKAGIRNILIAEGLCLLSVVMIPAMIIEYQFVRAGLIDTLGADPGGPVYLPDKTLLRFLITNIITWLVMAVVTVLAIWLPAAKAAGMEASDALRYE